MRAPIILLSAIDIASVFFMIFITLFLGTITMIMTNIQ